MNHSLFRDAALSVEGRLAAFLASTLEMPGALPAVIIKNVSRHGHMTLGGGVAKLPPHGNHGSLAILKQCLCA